MLDPRIQRLEQALSQNELRLFGHVLRISTERLARCRLFSEAGSDWKVSRGGQSVAWEKYSKFGQCRCR